MRPIRTSFTPATCSATSTAATLDSEICSRCGAWFADQRVYQQPLLLYQAEASLSLYPHTRLDTAYLDHYKRSGSVQQPSGGSNTSAELTLLLPDTYITVIFLACVAEQSGKNMGEKHSNNERGEQTMVGKADDACEDLPKGRLCVYGSSAKALPVWHRAWTSSLRKLPDGLCEQGQGSLQYCSSLITC